MIKNEAKKGFTLIEIIIVLVIISVFSGFTFFAISRMSNSKNEEKKTESTKNTDTSAKSNSNNNSNESLKVTSRNSSRSNDIAKLVAVINEHSTNNAGYKLISGKTTICGGVTDACPATKTQDNIDIILTLAKKNSQNSLRAQNLL